MAGPSELVSKEDPERVERAAADRHTLIAHAPDELECVISPGGRDRAVFAARVLDTALTASQLGYPINAEMLTDRRVGITELWAVDVPLVDITDPAGRRFGLKRSIATTILDDIDSQRRAVKMLRTRGCDDAIILPGLVEGTYSVAIPRRFLKSHLHLRGPTLTHPIPRSVVEHTLGIKMLSKAVGWDR